MTNTTGSFKGSFGIRLISVNFDDVPEWAGSLDAHGKIGAKLY